MYRHVESQVSARLQRQGNINEVHQSCAPRQRVRLSDAGEGWMAMVPPEPFLGPESGFGCVKR